MSVSDWSVFQSPWVSINKLKIPALPPSDANCFIAVWSGLIWSTTNVVELLETTLPVIVPISPLAVLNKFCDTVSPTVNDVEPAGDISVVLIVNDNLSSAINLSVTATPSPDSNITFCSSA